MTERLTSLEHAVVSKFCGQQGLDVPNPHEFAVTFRDRNPVGFMTEISCVKPLSYSRRAYEQIPDAVSLAVGTEIGFVLFFKDGLLNAIEGYSHGEEWPEPEWPVRFREGSDQTG